MSPCPRIFLRFNETKVAYSKVPRRRLLCRGCVWGARSAVDVHLTIFDMARFHARALRLGWQVNWTTINVSFRMTVSSDVSGSSAAITFAIPTRLAKLAGLDEFPLPGLHLDSEQVRVAGFVIIVDSKSESSSSTEIEARCDPSFMNRVGAPRG